MVQNLMKKQERLVEINEKLAFLNATFGQHVLKDEAEWILLLEQTDLSGLPDDLIASMKEIACERGHEGAYALTLARSIVEPFLKFSHRRDLREKHFKLGLSAVKIITRMIIVQFF